MELNDTQTAQFYHRSFTAADGLWFMSVEEKYGFEVALDIDNEVWKVLPRIQARMLKSMCNMENGMKALFECLTTRLALDGFGFNHLDTGNDSELKIMVNKCPWHDLMVKSGRESLSGRVGDLVCNTEYSAWASEFGENIRFELQSQICRGSESCVLHFSRVL